MLSFIDKIQALEGVESAPEVEEVITVEWYPPVINIADNKFYRHGYVNNLYNLIFGADIYAYNYRPKKLPAEIDPFVKMLAFALANIDGQYQAILNICKPVWEKFIKIPETVINDIDGKPLKLSEFVHKNHIIPIELSVVAGVSLTPENFLYVKESYGKFKTKEQSRVFRDFILGCLYFKIPLIDIIRTTSANFKTISDVMNYVAFAFRNDGGDKHPWATIGVALAKGENYIDKIFKTKGLAVFDSLGLDSKTGVPDGLKQVNGMSIQLANLWEFIGNDAAHSDRFDYNALRAPLKTAISEVLNGTWPKSKYENEVGKKTMALLTPEQQKIWKENGITRYDKKIPEKSVEFAQKLCNGIILALKKEYTLPESLTWSKESLQKLQKEVRVSLNKRWLTLLSLYVGLTEFLASAMVKDDFIKLNSSLLASFKLLVHFGSVGCKEAVIQLMTECQSNISNINIFATDQDSLEPMINSNVSGCLNVNSGHRRWGLVGALVDPNIKMLRAYCNNKMLYRGFLKFFIASFMANDKAYHGPVLWIDACVADGGGDLNHLNLMFKHAADKAKAMGIPLMTNHTNIDWSSPGFLSSPPIVDFEVPEGNTPVQHSDWLFEGIGNITPNFKKSYRPYVIKMPE